jgi:hypothetical protein
VALVARLLVVLAQLLFLVARAATPQQLPEQAVAAVVLAAHLEPVVRRAIRLILVLVAVAVITAHKVEHQAEVPVVRAETAEAHLAVLVALEPLLVLRLK